VQSDVRTESDVKDLIATVVKTYGGLHCALTMPESSRPPHC
jgi:hypothetical protein